MSDYLAAQYNEDSLRYSLARNQPDFRSVVVSALFPGRENHKAGVQEVVMGCAGIRAHAETRTCISFALCCNL